MEYRMILGAGLTILEKIVIKNILKYKLKQELSNNESNCANISGGGLSIWYKNESAGLKMVN